MIKRVNNIEDFIDAELEIDRIDRTIDEVSDHAFESFHRADDDDVITAKHFMEALDRLVNVIEFQNDKIKELEKKVDDLGS